MAPVLYDKMEEGGIPMVVQDKTSNPDKIDSNVSCKHTGYALLHKCMYPQPITWWERLRDRERGLHHHEALAPHLRS